MHRALSFLLAFFAMTGTAWAGTITASGNVTPLSDINEMILIDGMAEFQEGPTTGAVPLTAYSAQGMTFDIGTLPCSVPGTGSQAQYTTTNASNFPSPLGGGWYTSPSNRYAGVATFSVPVRQVGLTASTNGTQYLTAWNTSCVMIGQVTWVPGGTSGFVGLEATEDIYMVTYGNDDMWGGAAYGISGSSIYSDSWVWGSGTCGSSTITAVGAVTALTAYGQMNVVDGIAEYDEGPTSGGVPLTQYASQGMTFHTGTLANVLSGVTTPGTASQPNYATFASFAAPICGGGWHIGQSNMYAGVATFDTFVDQVGLTASTNGSQYLTVWDQSGQMLGQVNWVPNGSSSFVGIDTGGVPIGMVAYGNDNLWTGGTYSISGDTIISDSWAWGGYCTSNAQCDDGDVCNGTESCSGGSCTATAPLSCDDNNGCTDDSCHPTNGCTYVNNTSSCDDGTVCTTSDVCSGGTCGGTAIVCNDSDVCTDDSCHPTNGCTYTNNTASCDDGTVCTSGDVCSGGTCAGTAINCNDSNVCTDDSCHVTNGCTYVNNTGSCDDNTVCTTGDVCSGGTCSGTAIVCDDSDVCTDDSCHATNGCTYTNNTASCDDSDACTENDVCATGTCSGSAVTCDDTNVCTDDTCDSVNGCTYTDNTETCNDGDLCTENDACAAGACTGTTLNCDDGDICTDDSCGSAVGCINGPIANCCDDPSDCDPGEICDMNSNQCVPEGAGGAGGSSSSGTGGAGATPSGSSSGDTEESGGCGCQTPGSSPLAPNAAWLALLGLGMLTVRRRRST